VQHYIDQVAASLVARGLDPAGAARAQLEIGNATVTRERVRAYGGRTRSVNCSAICVLPFAACALILDSRS
jgi:hypothetical protein